MKGFIEVTTLDNIKNCISTESILRFYLYNDCVNIITKELVSRYECSNDNLVINTKESYQEIKQLIKEAM